MTTEVADGGINGMIELALSLLVDRESVTEAMVITDEGHVLCFPCFESEVSKAKVATYLALDLVKEDVLEPAKDHMIFYFSRSNMLVVPLSYDRSLVLFLNPKYNAEKLARDFIDVINRLREIGGLKSLGDGGSGEDEEDQAHVDITHMTLLRTLVKSGLMARALFIDLDDGMYSYPLPPRINSKVLNKMINFHGEFYEELRYKVIRGVIGGQHILVIPVSDRHVIIAEVGANVPTAAVLRRISLHKSGLMQ